MESLYFEDNVNFQHVFLINLHDVADVVFFFCEIYFPWMYNQNIDKK